MLEEKTIKEGRLKLHRKKHLLIQFKRFYFSKFELEKS